MPLERKYEVNNLYLLPLHPTHMKVTYAHDKVHFAFPPLIFHIFHTLRVRGQKSLNTYIKIICILKPPERRKIF